ncbi:isochorismatase family protein [Streptomyces sp. bgisy153]|uniref:isochorismatase family protein n=1 Tax=Streptomyces sp. bgisy153 TaxID=3413793 RepID=UPI003D71EB7B
MTTLPDRPHTALLVIDVQNGVVSEAHDREGVLRNIGTLVERARAADVPVVWIQHSDRWLKRDTDAWRDVPELVRGTAEPLVHKTYRDSFEATELESVLAGLGVGSLVVTGAQTDFCVRSTLHGALARGYDVTLVGDAHTTESLPVAGAPAPEQVIAHTNFYWNGQRAPGRRTATVATREVTF